MGSMVPYCTADANLPPLCNFGVYTARFNYRGTVNSRVHSLPLELLKC